MSFEDELCIPWSPLPQGTQENLGAQLDLESPLFPKFGSQENIEDLQSPLLFKVEKPKRNKKPMYISLFILLICVPPLIGACCWSTLVTRLVSGTTSSSTHKVGHWISFGITITMMVLLNRYIFRNVKNRSRRKGFCHYWGPFILTMCCAPLIMADLTRHVLQDTGIWRECDREPGVVWDSSCLWSSNQYRCSELPDVGCVPKSHETIAHLSTIGMMFTICFTHIGVAFLFVGVFWNAGILSKKQSKIKRKQTGHVFS